MDKEGIVGGYQLEYNIEVTGVAIDDPIDAIKKVHKDDGPYLPKDITILAAKLMLPGFVSTILGSVFERFGRKAQLERVNETFELLAHELKDVRDTAATKVEVNDLKGSVQLAIRHDMEEVNDKKRARYIKIIGNSLRSETAIEDLASFIQDIEQLGERDFVALKVLNKIMNKPSDWGNESTSKVHPNIFIHRRQELAVQMAQAFGMNTDLSSSGRTFSHEEGYEACTRLQGFGLAHEIEVSPREVPVGDYCFRPSKRGLLLLKLIGEQVANWDKYFPSPD